MLVINNRCPFEIEETSWLWNSDLIIFLLFLPSHISMRGGLGVINFKVVHFKLPVLGSLCCISQLFPPLAGPLYLSLRRDPLFLQKTSNTQSAMRARLVTVGVAALNVRMRRTTAHGSCVSLAFISSLTFCGYFAVLTPARSTFHSRRDHESTVLDLRVEPAPQTFPPAIANHSPFW